MEGGQGLFYCFSNGGGGGKSMVWRAVLPAKIRGSVYAAEEQIYVRQVDCTLPSTFSAGTVSAWLQPLPSLGHSSPMRPVL